MAERGLYLGKFAPFHRGHEHLVEVALDEVDELVVLVYPTDVIDVPLSVRADWIRDRYPELEVLEAWTGPTGSGYTEAIKRRHEEYILERLGEREVDRFYSSEPYGEHVSEALDARDRRVDPDREAVPISATEIRRDTYGNRAFVHPDVYADLVTTVAVLGGPSTGKTTLTEALADEFDTTYAREYGREYWAEHHDEDGRLALGQLVELAERHREIEDDRLREADEYCFVDTNAVYTRAYAKFYHDDVPPRLAELARRCRNRYDVTILCDTDVPFEDTDDRRGERTRRRLQTITRDFLDRHDVAYYVVCGTLEERVAAVKRILDDLRRYDGQRELPPE